MSRTQNNKQILAQPDFLLQFLLIRHLRQFFLTSERDLSIATDVAIEDWIRVVYGN